MSTGETQCIGKCLGCEAEGVGGGGSSWRGSDPSGGSVIPAHSGLLELLTQGCGVITAPAEELCVASIDFEQPQKSVCPTLGGGLPACLSWYSDSPGTR